jgi:hypothetical protein
MFSRVVPFKRIELPSRLLLIPSLILFLASAVLGQDCGPQGLVEWWPGDGNALGIVGGNNGVPVNSPDFSPAVVDRGFSFNGVNQCVRIPFM